VAYLFLLGSSLIRALQGAPAREGRLLNIEGVVAAEIVTPNGELRSISAGAEPNLS
jgi:hypothetical protein